MVIFFFGYFYKDIKKYIIGRRKKDWVEKFKRFLNHLVDRINFNYTYNAQADFPSRLRVNICKDKEFDSSVRAD